MIIVQPMAICVHGLNNNHSSMQAILYKQTIPLNSTVLFPVCVGLHQASKHCVFQECVMSTWNIREIQRTYPPY